MKLNRTLLILVLFVLNLNTSCQSKHKPGSARSIVADSVSIVPFVGIGDVVLGKSNIREVEKMFGKGERHRQWESPNEVDRGQIINTFFYPLLGMKFEEYRFSLFSENAIRSIELTGASKCKTKMGVGIGSTLNDLRREFGSGRLVIWVGSGNGEDSTEAYFIQGNVEMSFTCYDTDTTNYRVEKIRMHELW